MTLSRTHRSATFLASALLGAMILHVLLTGRTWVWNLLSPIPPLAFVLVPLAFITFAGWKRAWAACALGLVSLGVGWTQADIVLPHDIPPIAARTPLRVFTWNTEFWNDDATPTFYPFLRGQHADVYQMSEYWDRSGNGLALTEELAREFPEHAVFTSGELVTLVRRPFAASVVREHPSFLRVDVETGAGTMRFYNVHIPMQLGRDMAGIFARRQEAFTALEADLASADTPAFLAGDFNSTTAMGVMRPLLDRYADAATAGDAFLPTTWASSTAPLLRLWRIDFALMDPRLSALSYEEIDSIGNSDHLGLAVSIQ